MRARPLFAVPFVLFVASWAMSFVGAPACATKLCDPNVVEKPYGVESNQGDFIDDATWESTAIQTRWLDFPPNRTWRFRIPAWERAGRPFMAFSVQISDAVSPDQAGVGDNWTNAIGNLAEITVESPGNFTVTNATCATNYMRVVARAGDAPDGGVDGGNLR